MKKILAENQELAAEIEAKIRANLAAQKGDGAENTEQIKQSIVKAKMQEEKKPAKSKAAPTKSASKAMLDIAIEDDEEL